MEGSWVNEDGSLELKFQGSGEVTAVLPEFSEGGKVEIPMTYTLDKDDKNISISYDEEELRAIAEGSEGLYTEEMLENALSPVTTSFDYSVDQEELTPDRTRVWRTICIYRKIIETKYPAF